MANKYLERWYVEQLRRAIPDFPSGTVQGDESPDFIVQSDQRIVGIEVTAFHWPASEGTRPHQEEQALKDRAVATAVKIHAEAGGPALYVTVYFARPIAFAKRQVREQGESIARAVLHSAVPESLEEPPVRVQWDRLPSGVSEITIRASVHSRDRLWSADASGWVAPVDSSHIQSVLERKHEMATRAQRKCQELWLIIVNDEFSRGAPVELAVESRQAVYDHPFDRLFWLEPHRERAWELPPANRPLQPSSGADGTS